MFEWLNGVKCQPYAVEVGASGLLARQSIDF